LSILLFTVLLTLVSFLAGCLGALTGLGGGIIIIPVLVLFFHVPMHDAMGASLVSVIATSSGAAAAYLREGYTNLRIGMLLEVAAVTGAFIGALLVAIVPKTWLMILFSLVLFFSSYLTLQRQEENEHYTTSHPWATFFRLNGTYPYQGHTLTYHVQHVPLGVGLLGIAGLLSGLLGIGSGALKVLAMDQSLRLPYKVATTTSNFMIGITAAVSAGVYIAHGYINPQLTFPVLIGVLIGALCGTKMLSHLNTYLLRIIFSIAISIIGLQMLLHAMVGIL
jgi:uncharacterized membrane protein YfcA